MKTLIALLMVTGMVLVVFGGTADSGEKAPQKVFNLANTVLAELGRDLVIVKAVKEENVKSKTLDQIKALDEKWQAFAGIADYMKAMMDSPCGKRLAEIQKTTLYYAEIFVMDNQGANVAMTDKTSDYWQGDEAKFKKSFSDGIGSVFVDEVKFDNSTQNYLVQVSVPVRDGEKVIGAVTFGINIDKLE